MASIEYVVKATDAASGVFKRIALSADGLDRQLADLSKRVATPEVDLRDAKFTLGMINAAKRLDKLSAMVANPEVDVDTGKAQAEILRINAMLDRLDRKHVTSTVTVRQRIDKVAGAGFLQPSALGAAAALSPALIPLAGGIAAAVGAIAVSFGAAAAGAGAFGLLAKTALTNAGTAATAVQKAQQTYNAAIATGTKHATAYAAEQRAIKLAYAGMSPAQIALSRQVGDLSKAWDGVQRSLAPVISGALVPWLHAITDAMKLIKPFVAPVAAVFKDWGISLQKYFSSTIVAEQLRQLAVSFGKFSASQLRDIGSFLVNIGAAIFHLGTDLTAGGVNWGAFGDHLKAWGKAFDAWSKSAAARNDVGAFLKYIRDNGGRLAIIVKDIAKYVPGIFAGASAAGTLELQALSSFLGLLAKLPPGVARPLSEIAGAMLLLSKTGVLKVGLKLTGKLAEHPTALGFSIGTLLAAGIIDAVNQKRPGHGGQTWWQSFGPPDKAQQQTWLNSWSGLGDRIVQIADDVRHGVGTAWTIMWHHTLATTLQGNHDISAAFDHFRHGTAHLFDLLRHDIAAAWDAIWRGTKNAVTTGIAAVVSFFRGLPGKVLAALRGLGHSLGSFASAALTEMWNGFKHVGGSILHWLGGFLNSLVGLAKKILGVFSPSSVFFDIGKNLMLGLEGGIKAHAHAAVSAAQVAAHRVANVGAGVQRWAPLVSRALAMEGLSPRLLGNVLFQMQTESGGNPNAINLTDINAREGDPSRGLMQTIMSTFQAYHWPGTSNNIYDPLANIAAALNYGRHVYGPSLMRGGMGIGSGHGYALGGVITEPITGFGRSGRMYTFGERGPETVIPGKPGSGRGGVTINNNFGPGAISQDVDPLLLAQRMSFQITAASLGS